jgi:hypothetical protein
MVEQALSEIGEALVRGDAEKLSGSDAVDGSHPAVG